MSGHQEPYKIRPMYHAFENMNNEQFERLVIALCQFLLGTSTTALVQDQMEARMDFLKEPPRKFLVPRILGSAKLLSKLNIRKKLMRHALIKSSSATQTITQFWEMN